MNSILASMKASGRKLNSLAELLIEELKELYDVEDRLIEAMPKMIQAADSPHLKDALQKHLDRTKQQKHRIEMAFRRIGIEPEASRSEGIRGLLNQCDVIIRTEGNPSVRDAALVAAVQQIEHFEIAAYGSARAFAEKLNRNEVAQLLQETLDEETRANDLLTEVAFTQVNEKAAR